jgi:hypothetical protein
MCSCYAASIATTLLSRIALMSRIRGWPKKRLYSRLNWLALSYPTSYAALVASTRSFSMRSRATRRRSCCLEGVRHYSITIRPERNPVLNQESCLSSVHAVLPEWIPRRGPFREPSAVTLGGPGCGGQRLPHMSHPVRSRGTCSSIHARCKTLSGLGWHGHSTPRACAPPLW